MDDRGWVVAGPPSAASLCSSAAQLSGAQGRADSDRRLQPRFGVEAIADCFAELTTEVLGYRRFGAQGCDWGSFVTARLGYAYPERLSGIHLNMMPVQRDPTIVSNPT